MLLCKALRSIRNYSRIRNIFLFSKKYHYYRHTILPTRLKQLDLSFISFVSCANLPCWLLGCYRLLFTKHKKQLIFNSVGSSQLGSQSCFLRRSLHAHRCKVAPFLVANVIFNRQSPKYTYLKLTFEETEKKTHEERIAWISIAVRFRVVLVFGVRTQ